MFPVVALVSSLFFAPEAFAQEASAPRSYDAAGRVRVGVAALAIQAPGAAGLDPMLGVAVDLRYQRSRFAIGVEARGGERDNAASLRQFAALGLGAKYFFTDGGVSPFLGGGVAYSSTWISSRAPPGLLVSAAQVPFSGSASGAGAFAEIGVEIFRTKRIHLALALRIDAPFYSVPRFPTPFGAINDERVYSAPLSAALGFTF